MTQNMAKLWRESKLNRPRFFGYMMLLRWTFDFCGNATYATIWSFFFYVIYAAIQLYMVRARVRCYGGSAKYWTDFYGMGLVLGGMLVLLTTFPALSFITKQHHNILDFVFNMMTFFILIFLSIYNPPKNGYFAGMREWLQKSQFKARLVAVKVPVNRSNLSDPANGG